MLYNPDLEATCRKIREGMYACLDPKMKHRIHPTYTDRDSERETFLEYTGFDIFPNRHAPKKYRQMYQKFWKKSQSMNLRGFFLTVGQESDDFDPGLGYFLEKLFLDQIYKHLQDKFPPQHGKPPDKSTFIGIWTPIPEINPLQIEESKEIRQEEPPVGKMEVGAKMYLILWVPEI